MSTGELGEKLAAKFLRKKGWRIVKTNLRIDKDEIDILAVSPKGEILALLEVRSTKNTAKDPRATIGHEKRKCIRRAAEKLRSVAIFHHCKARIDLLTVNLGFSPPQIVHYEAIIPFSMQIKLSKYENI